MDLRAADGVGVGSSQQPEGVMWSSRRRRRQSATPGRQASGRVGKNFTTRNSNPRSFSASHNSQQLISHCTVLFNLGKKLYATQNLMRVIFQ